MLGKKSTQIALVVTLFLLTFSCFFVIHSKSWKNSPGTQGAYASRTGIPIVSYEADYYGSEFAQLRAFYGTHDWIAESALMVLFQHNQYNNFIKALYYDTDPLILKMFFLVGTEAPDVARTSGIVPHIELFDCLGRPYGSRSVGTFSHNMRFNGVACIESGCADGAQLCFSLAVQALIEHDCRKAAFYLGAMCHWIGDAASYCHLIVPAEVGGAPVLQGHKNSFENRMAKLTWRIERDRGLSLEYDFFRISEAQNTFVLNSMEHAWYSAYKVGLTTNSYKEYLWNTYEAYREGTLEVLLPPSPPTGHPDELIEWTKTEWNTFSTLRTTYLASVEHCLNSAILHCAQAMDFAISYYEDCDCNGQDAPLEEVEKILSPSLQLQALMLGIGTASIFATIYVFSLISSKKFTLF